MRTRLLVTPILVLACAAGASALLVRAEPVERLTVAAVEPSVVDVTCTEDGPEVSARVARASVDGVHLRFSNRTDRPQSIATARTGEVLPPGATTVVVSQVPPGEAEQVTCSAEPVEPTTPRLALPVTDPDGVFVEVPPCTGVSAVRDFAAGSEQQGDPLELTRRDAPDARVVGYPQGHPRQVHTGTERLGWEGSDRTGWVPTYSTRCEVPSAAAVKASARAR